MIMEWLENLKDYFRTMRKRNEESRAVNHQREVRSRIRLKISEDGEVLIVINNAGNETAIRKFADNETIKDVKATIKQVTEVAVNNSTAIHR